MATKKRQIAFYADDVVAEWYETLAPGEGTRKINDWVHAAIEAEQSKDERIRILEEKVEAMSYLQNCDAGAIGNLIEIVEGLVKQQARIFSFNRGGPIGEIEEEYENLKRALAITDRDHTIRGL